MAHRYPKPITAWDILIHGFLLLLTQGLWIFRIVYLWGRRAGASR